MILFLLGFMFMIFGFAWYVVGSMRHYRAGKDHELSPRPGPQAKAVPPFPFGPIADLIKDAEARAEREFFELFPEERPHPVQQPPSGYSLDSSPNGISNGVMTPNEWRELAQNMTHGQVMVLPDGTEYHSLMSPPKMADVGTLGKPYQRYIEGIGIITADSGYKLERACEVAIMEKFRESERDLRALDTLIHSVKETDHRMDIGKTSQKRREVWENCKLYLDLLQQLNL